MSANIFEPDPYVSQDQEACKSPLNQHIDNFIPCEYRCFVSGQPQLVQKRPVLRDPVTAFGQFPVENSWVNQILGVESKFNGQCNPPAKTVFYPNISTPTNLVN